MKAFTRIKTADVFVQPSGDISVCIDWEEVTITARTGEVNGYQCRRIDMCRGDLSTDAVIEKFVRDKYSQSEEFALINAYQASVAGIDPNPEKEAEYIDFLNWRKAMKDTVKEIIPAFIAAHPIEDFVQPELPTINQ